MANLIFTKQKNTNNNPKFPPSQEGRVFFNSPTTKNKTLQKTAKQIMEIFQNGTHFGGIKQAANVRDPLIFRVVFGLVSYSAH